VKQALLEILRAPGTRSALTRDGDALLAPDGRRYPIRDGVPRFVETDDAGQLQTRDSFGFKWAKQDTYDSPASLERMGQWLIERYGFNSIDEWAAHFDGFTRVLDVGCGGGLSSGTWLASSKWTGHAMWVGADISTAVDVAKRRLESRPNTHFVQADALDLPFADGTFEAVFSEGVLHHTPSTRSALLSATRVLKPGGELSFYVYRQKGAVREFTDDYVREQLRGLSDEAAWDVMRGFTRLAQALAAAQVDVEVTEAVPMLGIAAGKLPVQRFIYWNFAKLYWNDQMSFEENVHVNFDWYHPRYAHRQTEAEVRAWCDEAGVQINRLNEQESGYTVVGRKR
jgi:arsenite methyltransferase